MEFYHFFMTQIGRELNVYARNMFLKDVPVVVQVKVVDNWYEKHVGIAEQLEILS